ncbi:Pup--protein ligase [Blastococcus sp. Marseille-P5729]|uniref:Pup--protein ligase n=1 Tax=Blastococcus sp. Marseille-P5729 TaxID=2086582 RepID=UPI001F23F887|nr:Pup--protein ligase [Blastococcus sp. Marseille-P5729]
MSVLPRRIFGIETEYGVTCTFQGQRRLSPDEVARYLFRRVVSWGRSSNVFLANGSRLYLDVGSHPEYATAECDSLHDLVVHDRAGERILEGLMHEAEERLAAEGIDGQIYLFKNNTDSAGNSYGCHENYLITRNRELSKTTEVLVPFLLTRQIICGAGKVLQTAKGTVYAFSQRAEHVWEGVSSATTRSRPIINTRDEPHADAEKYRRLHVIVGDSNCSESTTLLKVASCDLVLRMVESGVSFPDLTIENPIRAIREISKNIDDLAAIRMANGSTMTAVEIQRVYLQRAIEFCAQNDVDPEHRQAVTLWEHTLDAIESGNYSAINRSIDWAIKKNLIDRYRERNGLDLDDPRVLQLDLAYHDIKRGRGLFPVLEAKGAVDRLSTDEQVSSAETTPPQTTRAKLRGDFVRTAQELRRDVTVDWVHLKLNDQSARTILCRDPFKNVDERVERMIEGMRQAAPRPR